MLFIAAMLGTLLNRHILVVGGTTWVQQATVRGRQLGPMARAMQCRQQLPHHAAVLEAMGGREKIVSARWRPVGAPCPPCAHCQL